MKMTRKMFAAKAETTDDEGTIRVICSTEDMDRGGEVIVQRGIDLQPYSANPVVLWQHDPMHPVGEATSIAMEDDRLVATVRFAPPGISATADMVRGLVKAGILKGVSVGINPVETEPMDPADGRKNAPVRYIKSELLEFSFVSIPANPNALVVSRSHKQRAEPVVKGMYEVGCLARALADLGYIRDSAAWERDMEGDASTLPERLGEIMREMGQALIDMTAEEVAEMLAAPMPGEDVKTASAAAAVTRFLAGWKDAPALAPVKRGSAIAQTRREVMLMELGGR